MACAVLLGTERIGWDQNTHGNKTTLPARAAAVPGVSMGQPWKMDSSTPSVCLILTFHGNCLWEVSFCSCTATSRPSECSWLTKAQQFGAVVAPTARRDSGTGGTVGQCPQGSPAVLGEEGASFSNLS